MLRQPLRKEINTSADFGRAVALLHHDGLDGDGLAVDPFIHHAHELAAEGQGLANRGVA